MRALYTDYKSLRRIRPFLFTIFSFKITSMIGISTLPLRSFENTTMKSAGSSTQQGKELHMRIAAIQLSLFGGARQFLTVKMLVVRTFQRYDLRARGTTKARL